MSTQDQKKRKEWTVEYIAGTRYVVIIRRIDEFDGAFNGVIRCINKQIIATDKRGRGPTEGVWIITPHYRLMIQPVRVQVSYYTDHISTYLHEKRPVSSEHPHQYPFLSRYFMAPRPLNLIPDPSSSLSPPEFSLPPSRPSQRGAYCSLPAPRYLSRLSRPISSSRIRPSSRCDRDLSSRRS